MRTTTQFPPLERVQTDFDAMRDAGVNTVRVYTPPRLSLLDAAAEHDLRVMVGVPWSQHVAFLDDIDQVGQRPPRQSWTHVRALSGHPAALMFAVGNEIPPAIVRWHGRKRVERFLTDLYEAAKDVAPDALFTYVNFPPTEYLDLSAFDVYAFNVYLHREADLRAYLARLHHVAGIKPLLLAEAGADSLREGDAEQARVTSMHVRAAFEEGLCGAVAFAWTDEWWRGGQDVTDWKFGLVDAERRPKPALAAVQQAFADAPFSADDRTRPGPGCRVVVCAYNAADTMTRVPGVARNVSTTRTSRSSSSTTGRATGPATWRGAPPTSVSRVIDIPNGGLSAARNVGLAQATGEIVAYTDSDVRVDPDWLDAPRPALPDLRCRRAAAVPTSCRPTTRGWRSAWRVRPAVRPTSCSTTGSPSTCPAATWRSGGTRARGDRRVQSHLPARRRRRRRVLAIAGARLARSASRRRRSSGTATATR